MDAPSTFKKNKRQLLTAEDLFVTCSRWISACVCVSQQIALHIASAQVMCLLFHLQSGHFLWNLFLRAIHTKRRMP